MILGHADSGFSETDGFFREKNRKVFFLGIGGVSMSALAAYSLDRGIAVSGSDARDFPEREALSLRGAKVYLGHRRENLSDEDLLVYSLALPEDAPELSEARVRGIPAVSRAEYLGALSHGFSERVGVLGSHGKSTVTAMLASVFSFAYRHPTVLSGAPLPSGSAYRAGGGETLIYEACEYRDSFLRFFPTVSVALNLELDHTDYFPDVSALERSFFAALSRTSRVAVLPADDARLSPMAEKLSCRVLTFGRSENADFLYTVTGIDRGFSSLRIAERGGSFVEFSLRVPGVHNARNAAAAFAAARASGISSEVAACALAAFSGIPRRLERIGTFDGRPVYYDYAHHPTEIAAGIETVREMTGGEVSVVFCPHTYSRTQSLFSGFAASLAKADSAFILPIYPAREAPIPGVTSEALADAVGGSAVLPDEVLSRLKSSSRGAILLMGAGDVSEIKRKLER